MNTTVLCSYRESLLKYILNSSRRGTHFGMIKKVEHAKRITCICNAKETFIKDLVKLMFQNY